MMNPKEKLQFDLATSEFDSLSPDDIKSLYYELHLHQEQLHVHQEELRVQNAELQEANERLKKAEKLNSVLFQSLPLPYCLIDSSAKIVDHNQHFRSIIEYNNHGIVGKPLSVFLTPSSRVFDKINSADLRSEALIEDKFELRNVAEHLSVPVKAHVTKVEISDTELFLITFTDISTEIIAQNVLKETMLKRNQLFGMVAHELRTPVAAISMMADQHHPEEWQRDRKAIKRTVSDLLNTIDDMRLLINPELVRPVRPEGFTISELNGAVASSVASIVAATGVQYQQYNAIAMPLIDDEFSTDTYRVRVAVTNIVKNACLHSRGSQVWMVSRMYTDQGEDFLEWLVADNGVGIPEDHVERLFEAGERGDSKAEGTGLGLFITKSWIEEIGGAVQYRARAKGGSEFMIRVPLINASDVQQVETEKLVVDTDRLETLMGQLNVLLVEDEAMLRMLGQKLVSKLVSNVQVAENGSDGLRAFDPAKHNVVLTDYFMPEMSGVEMSRRLREQGYNGVIIGITAATIGDQRKEMLQAGVDMVLPKPLNAEMFKNGIAQLMDDGRFDDLLSEVQS